MIWTIFPVFISERGQLPIAMAALVISRSSLVMFA
jgi:hypothetical protein